MINSIIEYKKVLERLSWLEMQEDIRSLMENEIYELAWLREIVLNFENDWNIN